KIDDVRIYNRALSAAEVSQLYSEESGEPNMVLVQGGTLPAGSALSSQTASAFHIARFETTWAEWKEVRAWAAANGYDIGSVGQGTADNHPVRNVSWYDAVKWCNAKSEMEGLNPSYSFNGSTYKSGEVIPTVLATANGYRLPAEAEGEWAGRGGVSSQGYAYSGSHEVTAVAWYNANSSDGTKAVGTKAANELGIHDMSGNLFEWCWNVYDPSPSYRRVRSGAWNSGANRCTVADRGYVGPGDRWPDVGFRYARSAIGDMVTVQGGTLPQGSGLANQTVQTFEIGRTEVTWGEWKTVRDWAATNGYNDLAGVGDTKPSGSADNFPVCYVSWYDVCKWSNAKSEKDGLTPVYQVGGATYRTGQSVPTVNSGANGYRLPLEKEWEWAVRGGVSSQGYNYSGSNDLNAVAWALINNNYSSGGTKAVGTKAANELGIHEMSGNAGEWCWDVYDPDPTARRLRGGCYFDVESFCWVAFRNGSYYPDSRIFSFGFRLARSSGN
ncbi:MAG: formylglycine-generating enzyme family protein, partial [Spartobacteria bacterium]